MNRLPADLEDLLDAAREGDEPLDCDRDRVRTLLAQRLRRAALLVSSSATVATVSTEAAALKGGTSGAAAGTATVVTSGSGTAVPTLVASLLVGVCAGALIVTGHTSRFLPMPAVTSAAKQGSGSAEHAVHGPKLENDGTPGVLDDRVSPLAPGRLPFKPADRSSSALGLDSLERRVVEAKHPSTGAPPREGRELRRTSPKLVQIELDLLRRAREALRAGQGPLALRVLDAHQAQFSNAALGEERQAMRVAALCQMDRFDEAREEASRFLRDSPGSPLAEGVRRSCGMVGAFRR